MSVENWPESVAGWELYRHGREENYRKRMANGLTVFATWDGERRSGVVEARVDPTGIGRTIASSRKEFRDKDAFFTAARLVVDMAANLPSLRMGRQSPADPLPASEVAGHAEAIPGSGDVPEAELTFTLTDGRSITLIMTEQQTDGLISSIHSISKHVWSEYHADEDDDPAGDSDPVESTEDVEDAEVPDVSRVDAGPDTGHELLTVLEQRFGVGEDYLLACVDWSAVVVVGEPAVSTLIERAEELTEAIAPGWFPGTMERPGEVWVVLHRAFAR
ncbi:hypothetical protein SAMN04488564_101812 [Lentzea waywayandensis]|uniref:Uncharacterized protein n=1 Tax=Lentzea waywayandensis TaxID=84724 RepID=A0A1I6D1Q1_9PSEU|nr:hypothetical protein [Lentzea waywayandensis]SFQ99243.1 hypothetical protein SAMN04488564_101812 [Lentzea waywayandensis]